VSEKDQHRSNWRLERPPHSAGRLASKTRRHACPREMICVCSDQGSRSPKSRDNGLQTSASVDLAHRSPERAAGPRRWRKPSPPYGAASRRASRSSYRYPAAAGIGLGHAVDTLSAGALRDRALRASTGSSTCGHFRVLTGWVLRLSRCGPRQVRGTVADYSVSRTKATINRAATSKSPTTKTMSRAGLNAECVHSRGSISLGGEGQVVVPGRSQTAITVIMATPRADRRSTDVLRSRRRCCSVMSTARSPLTGAGRLFEPRDWTVRPAVRHLLTGRSVNQNKTPTSTAKNTMVSALISTRHPLPRRSRLLTA